jgi:hypothetical protein
MIEIIIEVSLGILFVILFIALIVWAEKDMKKHPELIGKQTDDFEKAGRKLALSLFSI